MIRIAISKEAHAAIAATIEKGRALDALQEVEGGLLWIWLPKGEGRYVDALLVVLALEQLGGEASNWSRIMDGLWKQQQRPKS